MSSKLKPLLAGTVKDFSKIQYPVIGSPKLDGIRCLIVDGKAVSRNLKEIPNRFIAEELPKLCPNGFDGELLIKDDLFSFNACQSQIMKQTGTPDYVYYVFDHIQESSDKPYQERLKDLENSITDSSRICIVPTELINNENELRLAEEKAVLSGYEGLMIRSPNGKYKHGRSTENEGILLKIKRFEDSEAKILGFEEKMTNTNLKEKDAFGDSKRSSKKEGMIPANTLGAIHVEDVKSGVEFSIGSGFDDATRKDLWEMQDHLIGKFVKYKFQPSGMKLTEDGNGTPRFPVFLSFVNSEYIQTKQ